MKLRTEIVVALVVVALGATVAHADPVDISVNGGFEAGTFDGWSLFPSGDDQFTIVSPGSEGDYAACIQNDVAATAALMKNANVGIGVVEPGMEVSIAFDARGSLAAGAVAFAEFFSELGGGPLALAADPAVWTPFAFTTTTGPDVSGGVTLQLTATTGADPASVANVYYDNVSIIVESTVATEATTWSGVKTLF